MERFAKYRENISQMAEEDFGPELGGKPASRAVSKEEAASFVSGELSGDELKNGPNRAYLNRRRAVYIAQLIVGAILVVALIVFGFLIFGRH